jgi:predicted peptidase
MRLSRVLLTLLFATISEPLCAANIADFGDYSLRDSRGQILLPGRLFTPPDALIDPTTPRALMLYLHGGGAAGTNNVTQIEQTPDYMVDEAKQRGAYLYVPQTATTWASNSVVDLVMTMINRAVAEKNADTRRLYASGYSNGGGGTWTLLSRNKGRFAAAFCLAGISPASGFNAANLLGTAILAVHARDDATVSVTRSRTIVNGILAAAGQPLPNYGAAASDQIFAVSNPSFEFHRLATDYPPGAAINYYISKPDLDLLYLEAPTGDHTGLLGVFYSPNVYEWMFSHSTPEPGTLSLIMSGFAATAVRFRRRA